MFLVKFKVYLFTDINSATVKVTCMHAGSSYKAIKYSKSQNIY